MNILKTVVGLIRPAVPSKAPTQPSEVQTSRTASEPIRNLAAKTQLRQSPRYERTLIIGVDFGTNSTKVMWQDLSSGSFQVFCWQPGSRGLTSLLLPSTVTLRDGLLYFGMPKRDVRQGDIWLHSIKLCVLCHRRSSICRCGNATAKAGVIGFSKLTEPVPASSVACLFLAYVFREVEDRLVKQFPNELLHIIWNIGCPLDHLDSTGRRGEWERMSGAAMELRHSVTNRIRSSLLDLATQTIQGLNVPPDAIRNYFVQPEGLGAVKAFLESPHANGEHTLLLMLGLGRLKYLSFSTERWLGNLGSRIDPTTLRTRLRRSGAAR